VTGADALQASVAVLWCDSCAKKGDPCKPPLWCSKATIVAIDQYAEAATGNRDFFLNKPPGIAGKQGDIP
jgi:hypothetical protein